MKVLSTEGLTKLIDLIKSSFISNTDTETVDTVTLATVATTGAYSDLSGTPTVDQTYDGTSANAQSGVAVASAISGKADDNAVVHLAGTETITGTKTFDLNINSNADMWNIISHHNNITLGNTPSFNIWTGIQCLDSSSHEFGVLGVSYRTNGEMWSQIMATLGSTQSAIRAIVDANNVAYTYAPASDVNGSIVTTVSKTKSGNGGFKLGNGLIINFGHISSTNWSSNVYDVSYSIPFTTYGRIGFCRTSAATTTNDGGDYYARNPTTTGFNAYRTVTNTASIDWVAIGY